MQPCALILFVTKRKRVKNCRLNVSVTCVLEIMIVKLSRVALLLKPSLSVLDPDCYINQLFLLLAG